MDATGGVRWLAITPARGGHTGQHLPDPPHRTHARPARQLDTQTGTVVLAAGTSKYMGAIAKVLPIKVLTRRASSSTGRAADF
jgi:hypothetical protein